MKKIVLLLSLLICVFSLCACTPEQSEGGDHNEQNALGALTPQAALEYMKETENLVIVDVAATRWYEQKHFEGAINIPIEELTSAEEDALYADLPGGKPMILHCRAGAIVPEAYRRVLELRSDIPEISYIAGAPMFDEYNEWNVKTADGIYCTAIFNPFVCCYYADDVGNGTAVTAATDTVAAKTYYAQYAGILSGITVTGTPNKTTYSAFEEFDATGITVTANYTGGTNTTVTNFTIQYAGENTSLRVGETSVTIAYIEDGVLKTATVEGITVNPAAPTLTVSTDKTTVYQGQQPVLSKADGDTAGTLAWDEGQDWTTEGTKNYTWTFTPDDGNYSVKTGTISITVKENNARREGI